ncbi:MAG: PAS domain S-box protein [Chloroflexi bacterium]|nr:PAS domain S-box protein [Chloroflexota bacterium]
MVENTDKFEERWLLRIAELRAGLIQYENKIPDFNRLRAVLGEIEDTIQTITENVTEGIVITQDDKYVYANRAAADIFGYPREEIIGMPVTDVTLPGMRKSLSARDKMIQAGDSIVRVPEEWPVLRKDRTVRYVKAFAYRIIYFGKPASLVFFYDITEKKKMQDELSFNAYLLDMVTDAIFLLDMEGNIVYVNEAACEARGYTREELLQMNILDITAPEFKHKVNIRISQFSQRKESRFNSTHICKNGARIPIEVRGKIIQRGGKSFMLGVARDTSGTGPSKSAKSEAVINDGVDTAASQESSE